VTSITEPVRLSLGISTVTGILVVSSSVGYWILDIGLSDPPISNL
jgi:hypothetical protein